MNFIVPNVGFRANRHCERDEIVERRIGNVSHHAPEIANLFENSNVLVKDMDI